MLTCSLQSGSNGNSIYVEAGDVRLLFDAGISGRQIRDRLKQHGRNVRDLHALIISHDHSDHTCGAGVVQRLFGVPIYATPATDGVMRKSIGRVPNVRHFHAGESLRFGNVFVHTIRTPHDAVDSVMFVVEHEGRRLGIFTDLGHAFLGLLKALGEVNAAYLESNYDPNLLANGPYSDDLKRRIRGGRGHLSNFESADLVCACAKSKPRWIALAHLSENNNTPELAFETHRKRVGRDFPYYLASRHAVSELLEV